MTTQSNNPAKTIAPAKKKAPAKRRATPAKKSAAKTPIAKVPEKSTPAKAAPPAKATKIKLQPVKSWKINFRDASVNGAIVEAITAGATDLDALVEYFKEHTGMAPNKSAEYAQKPKQYIAGYITYLVKHNVVTRA